MSTTHAVLKQRIVGLLNNGSLIDAQEAGAAFIKPLEAIEKACRSSYGATAPSLQAPNMPWYTLAVIHNVSDVSQVDWWRLTSTVSLVLDSARTLLIHAIHVHALRLAGAETAPLLKTVMERHANWWLLHTYHNAHQMEMFNVATGFVDSMHEINSAKKLADIFGQTPEDMSTALLTVRQNLMLMLKPSLLSTIADIAVMQGDMTMIPCLVPIGSLCLFHRLDPTRQDVLRVVTKDSCVVVQTVDNVYHKIFARGIPFYVDVFAQEACHARTGMLKTPEHKTIDQTPRQITNHDQTNDKQTIEHNRPPQHNNVGDRRVDVDVPDETYKPRYIAGDSNNEQEEQPEDTTSETLEAPTTAVETPNGDAVLQVEEADTEQRLHEERLHQQKESEKHSRISLYLQADRCLICATDFARKAFKGVAMKQRQNDIEHRETKIQEIADYIGGQSEALQQLRASEERFWQGTILPQLAASMSIKQYNKAILRQTAFAAELRADANEIAHA